MTTVLFTSVGRRVTLVRQVREAAARLGGAVAIIGTDVDPLAPALQVVDIGLRVPRYSEPGYVERLKELCVSHGVDVAVPLSDPDARLLALNRGLLEDTGAVVSAVSPESAEIVDDKWETFLFLSRIGIRTPTTWLDEDHRPEDVGTYLLKPRRGSAGKGIQVVRPGASAFIPEGYLAQELADGPEITVDLACDQDGQVIGVGMRERLEVRAGEVSKSRTIVNAEVEEAAVLIASNLNAVGFLTAQCFATNDGPVFIEVNGRIGGGAPLSIQAGYAGDEALCRLFRPATSARELAAVDHFMTRYDDQFFSTGMPTTFSNERRG